MRQASLALTAVLLLALVPASPANAAGGEGETWPAFTESSGCGASSLSTPLNHYMGWLNVRANLRGEYGAVFGRTVKNVLREIVRWEIPGSTEELALHPSLIPALEEVQAELEAELEAGNHYRITNKWTFSAAARTIGGKHRISRHTYGLAFDINAHKNRFSRQNHLRTNLPDWWVQPFLDAGFCWGGLWNGAKDTMHFSWQGPALSNGDSLPLPYPPLTEAVPFGTMDASIPVEPRAGEGLIATSLTDVNGNGAVDVVRLRRTGRQLFIDTSVSTLRHNACSVWSNPVAGIDRVADTAVATGFGDWDGRGGQDLWFITDDDGSLRLTVRWSFGDYAAETSATTGIPTYSNSARFSTADFDVDGALDLYVIDGNELTVWNVDPDSGDTSELFSAELPVTPGMHFTFGDRDLDNRPDLWTIVDDTVLMLTAANGYGSVDERHSPDALPHRIVDISGTDYDGDGRDDLIIFDGQNKKVWLANTRLDDGLPLEVWFETQELDCTTGPFSWDRGEVGLSTSGSVAVGSFEWRDRYGMPVGCDPEEDDCTRPVVTHRSYAEFLAWVLDLEPVPGNGALTAPRAVAQAGYDAGCPTFDLTCWGTPMLQTELNARFGMFLADRHGGVPPPHRWVLPVPTTPAPTTPH